MFPALLLSDAWPNHCSYLQFILPRCCELEWHVHCYISALFYFHIFSFPFSLCHMRVHWTTCSYLQQCIWHNRLSYRRRTARNAMSVNITGWMRGSASPVLTATGFVSGRRQFSTPHRINTPWPITKKFGTGDYVGGPCGCAKFGENASMGTSGQMGKI